MHLNMNEHTIGLTPVLKTEKYKWPISPQNSILIKCVDETLIFSVIWWSENLIYSFTRSFLEVSLNCYFQLSGWVHTVHGFSSVWSGSQQLLTVNLLFTVLLIVLQTFFLSITTCKVITLNETKNSRNI